VKSISDFKKLPDGFKPITSVVSCYLNTHIASVDHRKEESRAQPQWLIPESFQQT